MQNAPTGTTGLTVRFGDRLIRLDEASVKMRPVRLLASQRPMQSIGEQPPPPGDTRGHRMFNSDLYKKNPC
jgi:hypothetical protein